MTSMTAAQIAARLVEIDTAYVQRREQQPYVGARIEVFSSGALRLWMAGISVENYIEHNGDDLSAVMGAMMAEILAMPSAEEAARAEWHRNLSNLIDSGREIGIDDSFVNPLAEMSQALSEGAITYQEDRP